LERRTAQGGRDSIDHPPGAHDDLANAAAGALVSVSGDPLPLRGRNIYLYYKQCAEALPTSPVRIELNSLVDRGPSPSAEDNRVEWRRRFDAIQAGRNRFDNPGSRAKPTNRNPFQPGCVEHVRWEEEERRRLVSTAVNEVFNNDPQ